MHRRSLLARLVTIALWPRATHAEPLSAPALVGYLGFARGPLYDAFLNGVREYGYVDGQDRVVCRLDAPDCVAPKTCEKLKNPDYKTFGVCLPP